MASYEAAAQSSKSNMAKKCSTDARSNAKIDSIFRYLCYAVANTMVQLIGRAHASMMQMRGSIQIIEACAFSIRLERSDLKGQT
jgi:hypothetical protein